MFGFISHADLLASINQIHKQVGKINLRLTRPGNPTLIHTGISDMALTFKVSLPNLPTDPHANQEIASGSLSVSINGADPITVETTKDATEVENEAFLGPDGATVVLEFAYVDDAGNRSANPAAAATILADTIPPVDPENVGLVVTGEIPDPEPQPEPPA